MLKEKEKDINYVGRDFDGFKSNLIEYAKNYFPNSYNDFSSASPGSMFIEMAAYVGDVLSYYTDYSLKESMLHRAEERKNVYSLAQSFGYKPKISIASTCTVDVFQLVPSTWTTDPGASTRGASSQPDWDYALIIEEGMELKTDGDIKFRTTEPINFAASSSFNPTEVTVYQTNATTGQPEYYLLKTKAKVVSGKESTITENISTVVKNRKVKLTTANIVEITSVVDSDGFTWYEVPYLAQDTIFEENVNTEAFDPLLNSDKVNSPYILSLKKTARRFITRIDENNNMELQFGAGISNNSDVSILPSPLNVGTNLPGSTNKLDQAFDPSNFMYSKTYGKAPDTSLTIKYSTGYGLEGNVAQGLINTIVNKTCTYTSDGFDSTIMNDTIIPSLAVSNPEPATGGKSAETLDEVRNNALAYFSTQQRAVTREDYIIRAYSMPGKFGSVAKVFVGPDTQIDLKTKEEVANPLALNMYVLGYDNFKNLTDLNTATKRNLQTYLSQYRMLTDSINIKNGYVINIGIDFEVVVLPGRNSRDVIIRCIDKLKELFHIDRQHFNQPIIVKDLILELANIDGVQSVVNVDIRNKWRTTLGYSGNKYNMEDATKAGIVYPSLDPSVFEVKFPDQDIRGRATTY